MTTKMTHRQLIKRIENGTASVNAWSDNGDGTALVDVTLYTSLGRGVRVNVTITRLIQE